MAKPTPIHKNPRPGTRTSTADREPSHQAGGSRYAKAPQIRPTKLDQLKPSKSDPSSFSPSNSSQTAGNSKAARDQLAGASGGDPRRESAK